MPYQIIEEWEWGDDDPGWDRALRAFAIEWLVASCGPPPPQTTIDFVIEGQDALKGKTNIYWYFLALVWSSTYDRLSWENWKYIEICRKSLAYFPKYVNTDELHRAKDEINRIRSIFLPDLHDSSLEKKWNPGNKDLESKHGLIQLIDELIIAEYSYENGSEKVTRELSDWVSDRLGYMAGSFFPSNSRNLASFIVENGNIEKALNWVNEMRKASPGEICLYTVLEQLDPSNF